MGVASLSMNHSHLNPGAAEQDGRVPVSWTQRIERLPVWAKRLMLVLPRVAVALSMLVLVVSMIDGFRITYGEALPLLPDDFYDMPLFLLIWLAGAAGSLTMVLQGWIRYRSMALGTCFCVVFAAWMITWCLMSSVLV